MTENFAADSGKHVTGPEVKIAPSEKTNTSATVDVLSMNAGTSTPMTDVSKMNAGTSKPMADVFKMNAGTSKPMADVLSIDADASKFATYVSSTDSGASKPATSGVTTAGNGARTPAVISSSNLGEKGENLDTGITFGMKTDALTSPLNRDSGGKEVRITDGGNGSMIIDDLRSQMRGTKAKRLKKDKSGKRDTRQVEPKKEEVAPAPESDAAPKPRKKKRPNRYTIFLSKLGKTRVYVKGKNGVRCLGMLMKICRVTDVRTDENGVIFDVPSKLLSKIVALLDNLCYDYKIIGQYGLAPALMRGATRVGLAVGVVLAAVMIAIYPGFVTRVSITPAAGQSIDGALNGKIYGILSAHGVRRGAYMTALDEDGIGKELLSLDGVSYASVTRRGTHIDVFIKQELDGERYVDIAGSAVRATRLATVTRVIVEGGTALKKYGDVVQAGDVIIDGYVMYGEDKLPVEAKGRAYGTVLIKASEYFADTLLEKRYGKVKRVTKLGLFGKVPKPPASPFECCEIRTEESAFSFLAPIRIYTYEFRELIVSEKRNELSDSDLFDVVYARLIGGLEETAVIKNVYKDITYASGGRQVDMTIEAEVLISG